MSSPFTFCCCWCIVNINDMQQIIVSDCTTKKIVNGPICCHVIAPWSTYVTVERLDLKLNEYILINNTQDPKLDRYEYGPQLTQLSSPFERYGVAATCPVLDQDDYLTVSDIKGVKTNHRGPLVYRPKLGDVFGDSKNTIQVPINYYIVVNDSNNPSRPTTHLRGPLKFSPEPFQSIVKNGATDYYPCFEITPTSAIHLQKANGQVELLQDPQFYMPEVGEKLAQKVDRTILLQTDFCILKSPDGKVEVKDGQKAEDRSFFLKPFYAFLTFKCDKTLSILSTLPTFLSHNINIRTSDNVMLVIDLRISYQIKNLYQFSDNPVEFYGYIKNHVQNDLLDRFSQSTLRQFMSTFSKIAQQSIDPTSNHFEQFGISILDVQILNYNCTEKSTQELLNQDIHTNVNKQNELRARQNDILIQEQSNEVMRRTKDLEVQMAQKDNEVALEKKKLENEIRLKEMEIEIAEEKKRTELLEVRRNNDLVEAEFEGKAKGHELREFLMGIDEGLDIESKIKVWMKMQDVEQSVYLYDKVSNINMYPPGADLKLFNFSEGQEDNHVVFENKNKEIPIIHKGKGSAR